MKLFKIDWETRKVISEEYSEDQIQEINSSKDYIKKKDGYFYCPYWLNESLYFEEEYAEKILNILIDFSNSFKN